MNIFEYFKKKILIRLTPHSIARLRNGTAGTGVMLESFISTAYMAGRGPGRGAGGIAWGWQRRYVRTWLTCC